MLYTFIPSYISNAGDMGSFIPKYLALLSICRSDFILIRLIVALSLHVKQVNRYWTYFRFVRLPTQFENDTYIMHAVYAHIHHDHVLVVSVQLASFIMVYQCYIYTYYYHNYCLVIKSSTTQSGTRQSEMANTSPRHMPVLGKFTPLKSQILIFFRDVISLLARVFILLIDTATQEVPMKNIWKKSSVQFLRYASEVLHVKRRTCHKLR